MIPVPILGIHKVYHPAFNFTVKAMNSYGAREGNTEEYRKMVALSSKTCYTNIVDVDKLLLPFPLKEEDYVAILVLDYPVADHFILAEFFLEEQADGQSIGIALIQNILEEKTNERN